MLKANLLGRRSLTLLVILLILAPSLLTDFLRPSVAGAAGQISHRSIAIASSVVSATDVQYAVTFSAYTTGTIKGIVVQFCSNSPLIGVSCTAPTGFNINKATLVVANQQIGGTSVTNAYTINAASNSNTLILTNSTGNNANGNPTPQAVTFNLGTNAQAGDGVTNPSTLGTYYARILTYSNNTTAAAYADTVPGAYVDYGGIALSTANQLTTLARVQEKLVFCVGTTSVDDATTNIATDCTGSFAGNCGTAVDLGVLDSSVVSVSPVPTAPGTPGGGNACNGAAMVQTNASNGVAISYFANKDTSSGQLKVTGATCSGSSTSDQCFNDSSTQGTFTAGTEDFGVTVGGTNCDNTSTPAYSCAMASGTNHLIATSGYIGDNTTTYGTTLGFAWQDGVSSPSTTYTPATQLASSAGPVDNETLILKFAATPNLITPTGTYTVTSTYIATATF